MSMIATLLMALHYWTLMVELLRDNFMTLNTSKCHLLMARYKDDLIFASVEDALLWGEQSAKLLGILINSSLKFDDHVKMICKKDSQKLKSISRILNFMSQEKRQISIQNFFVSQHNYCSLTWMFCGRTHRMNKLYERALRIAYNDYASNFEEVHKKYCTVTIH